MMPMYYARNMNMRWIISDLFEAVDMLNLLYFWLSN